MIKVGVMGASGYMGGEAIRILLEHPQVELVWGSSRSVDRIEKSHRNLLQAPVKMLRPENVTSCDVVFLALPSGEAMNLAPQFLDNQTKVIDLGADFRLKDIASWERVYKKQHSARVLAARAVYGIGELHREDIKKTNLVANPGCFSSAVILGLAPLLKENLVERDKIVVDGLSGTAGAGAETDPALHHPELANNVLPYNVIRHRHSLEMEQELSLLAQAKVTVHFTSSLVPASRGILAISHLFPTQKVDRNKLLELYQDFYHDEFFIKITNEPPNPKVAWNYLPYPWMSSVSGTNFCYIGLDYDDERDRIVVFSVLDNMGKGGSHAGIQNMNIMCGLDEKTGLKRYGSHPY